MSFYAWLIAKAHPDSLAGPLARWATLDESWPTATDDLDALRAYFRNRAPPAPFGVVAVLTAAHRAWRIERSPA